MLSGSIVALVTPMHVGGVNLFTLPKGVDEQSFLHGIADNMREVEECQPPFGDRLKMGRLGAWDNSLTSLSYRATAKSRTS